MEREDGERGRKEELKRHAQTQLARAMAFKLLLVAIVALFALYEFLSDSSSENYSVTALSARSRSISRRLMASPTRRLPSAKVRASIDADRWSQVFYTRTSDTVSYRSRGPKAVSKSCDLETERERCASREIGDRVEGADQREQRRRRVQLRRQRRDSIFGGELVEVVYLQHARPQNLGQRVS